MQRSSFFVWVWAASLALLLVSVPSRGEAFDYLEHSYFSDAACTRAQHMLAPRVAQHPEDDALVARYLALALFCPARWEPNYCEDRQKLNEGSIHELEAPAREGGELSLTLGDYAALPDHFARYGPVKGLALAGGDGLLDWTMRWLARERAGGVGGTVEKVAGDACHTRDRPSWPQIQADLDVYFEQAVARGAPGEVPGALLSPLAREPIARGPYDPAGLYSFANPHYLDLVLRNHHHFGVQSYSAWLGFHSTAVQLSGRRCAETLGLTPRRIKRLARATPGMGGLDWDAMSDEERAELGCVVIGQLILRRLSSWRGRGDATLVKAVSGQLALLANESPGATEALRATRLLDLTTAAVMGLVFEGSGLHFLQDGLAGGHMRTIRTRGGLLEARHDHDLDNEHGVVAVLSTRAPGAPFPFVAFGDSYLLGPQPEGTTPCQGFLEMKEMGPAQVSACLLQHQRGLLMMVSLASLLDWALGGTLYGVKAAAASRAAGESLCDGLDELERVICAHLPNRATCVAGEEQPEGSGGGVMQHGSLPVPPLPYSYEALTTRIGFDVAGRSPQVSVSFTLLSELDDLANWLTSYRIGLNASLGNDADRQWFTDFTYGFHWRWAARVLIELGASGYVGFRDFAADAPRSQLFMGVSPVVGFTVLPEGWLKIPAELSLSYRLPLNLFAAREGFLEGPVRDGHWIYVGFGLAFMR